MNKKLEILLEEIESIPLSSWEHSIKCDWDKYPPKKTDEYYAHYSDLSAWFSMPGEVLSVLRNCNRLEIYYSEKTKPITRKVEHYIQGKYAKEQQEQLERELLQQREEKERELLRQREEQERRERGYRGNIDEILKK